MKMKTPEFPGFLILKLLYQKTTAAMGWFFYAETSSKIVQLHSGKDI